MTNLDKEEQELLDSYERGEWIEEQELLDSYERGEWISDYTPERLKQLQSYAKATLIEEKANLQKLLALLEDGRWHSGNELADKVSWRFGHTISEARKKGYSVEKRKTECNSFEYRMISA